MTRFSAAAILLASGALALGACSNEPDTADSTDVAVDLPDTNLTDNDAMPVGGEMNPDQQANYDALDRQAISDEYDTNRVAMNADSGSAAGSSASSTPSDSTMGSSGGMSGPMPARGQMDFSYLDRNGDSQLSVAEYAIWAVPANPNTPAANDETKPFLTSDQINTAGQTFFYFDENGDTYLSQSEFDNARASGRTS